MKIPAPPRDVSPEVETWMQTVRAMLNEYVFIPIVEGAPSDTPPDVDRAAICYDNTNNRFYIYDPATGWVYAAMT